MTESKNLRTDWHNVMPEINKILKSIIANQEQRIDTLLFDLQEMRNIQAWVQQLEYDAKYEVKL